MYPAFLKPTTQGLLSPQEPILKADKIIETKVNNVAQSIWMISFNGNPLFNLIGIYGEGSDCKNGVQAIQIASHIKLSDLMGYERKYQKKAEIHSVPSILNIKVVNQDQRGIILAVEYLGKEIFSLIGTHKGYARGGHSHPYPTKMIMPIGNGEWFLQKNIVTEITTKTQEAGQELIIDKDEIHYVIAKEDLLLTENPLVEGTVFTAINDPQSRKIVDQINSKL